MNNSGQKIKDELTEILLAFNKEHFGNSKDVGYSLSYRGKYIYITGFRGEIYKKVGRLTYEDDLQDMEFAVYKYSSEKFDPDEFLFPGREHLDGTLKGALKASLELYQIQIVSAVAHNRYTCLAKLTLSCGLHLASFPDLVNSANP